MPNEFKVKNGLLVSGSANINASGSEVFTVDGTSGRLFQIDDSLSGSLFSVNTAAGLPIIEAFSDNTVRIGQFGQKALFVSQSRVGIGKESALNAVLDISGSLIVTGSLTVTGNVNATSFTGSLLGTASFATTAQTASSADNFIVRQAITASSALINGTITAQTLVVQTITSSTDFVTGSTRFGSLLTNTHQFTGSVGITGSLQVTGNTVITGSLTVLGGITGSLFGTASWAQNAQTASFITASNVFGPYGSNSILSSSFAVSASWAPSTGGGSITVGDEGTTQGTATYFNFIGAGVTATVTSNTASITIPGGGGGGTSAKAGSGSAELFTGTPRSASITFGSAFSDNLYAVTVTGEDARSWTIQSKSSTGFTINSNSSVALTGPVYWIATAFN